jgi:hypothetical protein
METDNRLRETRECGEIGRNDGFEVWVRVFVSALENDAVRASVVIHVIPAEFESNIEKNVEGRNAVGEDRCPCIPTISIPSNR